MRIRVLGSAAGGGFPQWNCACPNCRSVREGSGDRRPRTQTSVAITTDGDTWFLLGASPEIRGQIESFPPLHPRAPRHTPIAGIVLTNGDLDQCLGLLSLREFQPLQIYATDQVCRGFTEGNVLYRTLDRFPGQVTWRALKLECECPLLTAEGKPSGLTITAIPVPGKVPFHLEGRIHPDPEDNVGLVIRKTASARMVAYVPGVAARTRELDRMLQQADCIFFDGTFWSSDELIALGFSRRRAEEMAHWPVGGQTGSLHVLAQMSASYRGLIHINNTNPILDEASPQRRQVDAAGIEVAYDGMEITL
jgi:pyrroloquinoline quinone biosynthesis protein B